MKKVFGSTSKRIIAMIIVAVMVFPLCTSGASELLLGDANCDGIITTGDCVMVLRHTLGENVLGFYGRLAADVNADKLINTGDATLIIQHVALENPFPGNPLKTYNDNPLPYNSIPYNRLISHDSEIGIILCEYTSYCINDPMGDDTFGIGYCVQLEEDTVTVFETGMFDDSPIDTRLYIFDNSMCLVAVDDNCGDGSFSRIEFECKASGTYKILIASAGIDSVGVFMLYTSREITPATPCPTNNDPTPTPTQVVPTPTETPLPTPQNSDIEFDNGTLPCDDQLVQYKSPYTIAGQLLSKHPLLGIRVAISDCMTGVIEQQSERTFTADENIKLFSLGGGSESIDAELEFSSLTFGAKRIVLYCETTESDECAVFVGRFFVGAMPDKLIGFGYMANSRPMSAAQRLQIACHINSLDMANTGNRSIMEGFPYLGTRYGTGSGELDCSALVQAAYVAAGVTLPRVSSDQALYCYEHYGEIPFENLIPGDLVFFRENTCPGCGRFREIHHVAIYVGTVGSVRFLIESSSGKGAVVLRPLWGTAPGGSWEVSFYSRPR